MATSRTLQYGYAGGRAAGSICRQGAELEFPHLQLAADEANGFRVVETATRANGLLFRRIPDRSHPGLLSHLERSDACRGRNPWLFRAGAAGDGGGIPTARHLVRPGSLREAVDQRASARRSVW